MVWKFLSVSKEVEIPKKAESFLQRQLFNRIKFEIWENLPKIKC